MLHIRTIVEAFELHVFSFNFIFLWRGWFFKIEPVLRLHGRSLRERVSRHRRHLSTSTYFILMYGVVKIRSFPRSRLSRLTNFYESSDCAASCVVSSLGKKTTCKSVYVIVLWQHLANIWPMLGKFNQLLTNLINFDSTISQTCQTWSTFGNKANFSQTSINFWQISVNLVQHLSIVIFLRKTVELNGKIDDWVVR